MNEYLINRVPFFGVNIKHIFEQVLQRLAEMGRHPELPFFDLAVEHTHILILEGQEPTVHREEYNPRRPYINFRGIILQLRYHLWSCVAGRSTRSLEQITVFEEVP